ncbi:nitrate reductase molybdenum cofactor assembly chaperone [Rhodobacteraceae bacterium WD3A24]|nr:nitrate reductase molybdenum cofactor assembly chaperone [Rhodobacteraceae bacterium WD3A24]
MTDRTLKALSLLLSYPTAELQAASPEIGDVIAGDARLTPTARDALCPLIEWLAQGEIYEVQEGYVTLFDRTRSLSLNLFEHVHGESRERGGAMVSLVETYRAAGFEPATSELPDHLPVVLEYLSTRPAAEAQDMLQDAGHIIEALGERLSRRGSPYAPVFTALLQIAGARADREAVAELLDQPDDDPADLEALDAVWEETEVTFGPDPNAGCPQVRDILARMDTPTTPASVTPGAAE